MIGAGSSYTRTSKIMKAAPEALYRALSTPLPLVVWLPQGKMAGEIHSFEARVGGSYRMSVFYPLSDQVHRGKTSDREDCFTARFVELAPPVKIVQVVPFHSTDPTFSGEMTFEATFEATEGGTQVTIVCSHIPSGIRAEDNELAVNRHLRSWLVTSSSKTVDLPAANRRGCSAGGSC